MQMADVSETVCIKLWKAVLSSTLDKFGGIFQMDTLLQLAV